MNTRSDTRSRIQEVALELFAEQGYDKTSLREIAERLGVTKAALYYHFKTKEEIVTSLFEAAFAGINQLVDWAAEREPTPENRRELLRLYAQGVSDGQAFRLMRLMQDSQHTLRELAAGHKGRERMQDLVDFLVDKDAPLTVQLKARMSLMVMNFSMFALHDTGASEKERLDAALEVGLELLG